MPNPLALSFAVLPTERHLNKIYISTTTRIHDKGLVSLRDCGKDYLRDRSVFANFGGLSLFFLRSNHLSKRLRTTVLFIS